MSRFTWPLLSAGLIALLVYVHFFPRPAQSQSQEDRRTRALLPLGPERGLSQATVHQESEPKIILSQYRFPSEVPSCQRPAMRVSSFVPAVDPTILEETEFLEDETQQTPEPEVGQKPEASKKPENDQKSESSKKAEEPKEIKGESPTTADVPPPVPPIPTVPPPPPFPTSPAPSTPDTPAPKTNDNPTPKNTETPPQTIDVTLPKGNDPTPPKTTDSAAPKVIDPPAPKDPAAETPIPPPPVKPVTPPAIPLDNPLATPTTNNPPPLGLVPGKATTDQPSIPTPPAPVVPAPTTGSLLAPNPPATGTTESKSVPAAPAPIAPNPPVPQTPETKPAQEAARPITSPWSFHLEIVDGKNLLTAKAGKAIQFSVACEKIELQSPNGNIQASGNVKIVSQKLEAISERLTINLQEDILLLEGKAHLKCRREEHDMELRAERFSLRLSEIQGQSQSAPTNSAPSPASIPSSQSSLDRPPEIRASRETHQ